MPVHDGDQVEESPGHGQVGDVGRPYLVRPGDRQIAKQLGIHSPFRRWLAGARLPVAGPQSHQSHEPLHPLPAYHHTLPVQRSLHPPGTVAGGFQLLAVQLPHQGQVLLPGPLGAVVEAGAADSQQLALPRYRQGAMLPVYQLTPLCWGHRPDLSSKKSHSTLSWPICWYSRATRASLLFCALPLLVPLPWSKIVAAPPHRAFFQV